MIHSLDTNACIRYLTGRSDGLRQRLDAADPHGVVICSVVRAELFYGAAKSRSPQRTLDLQRQFVTRFATLPFDDLAAARYGPIRAELERLGTTIGANDLLIAAIALTHQLVLVTHNVNEFSRIPGLRIEDWETAA